MTEIVSATSEPLVSAIIPTRNRANLLARSLESVLHQHYRNFEVIVIDDASVDDTRHTIEQFKNKFQNFKYIRNNKQMGGAEARNLGIAAASGKYIAFLDDDDEWLPDKTSEQVSFLEHNQTIGALTCWYYKIDKSGRKKVQLVPEITFELMLWENFAGSFSLCLVRAPLARSIILNPELKTGQDWHFWIMISMFSNIAISNKCLVNYHNHSGLRISNSKNYISSSQRNLYFKYKKNMMARCRIYAIVNILRYRILRSNRSKLLKIYRILSNGIFIKTREGRFFLKRSIMIYLDNQLKLNKYNPDLATYRFINKVPKGLPIKYWIFMISTQIS